MGASFGAGDRVPDATALPGFRRLVESHGPGRGMPGCANVALGRKGVMMRGGTISGATFVEAPSSTKGAEGARGPEMHQGKKGRSRHFGLKAHVGADVGGGLAHSVEVAPASVSDVAMAHALVRVDDTFRCADSGRAGVAERLEVAGDEALSGIERIIARKPPAVKGLDAACSAERGIGPRRASVRAKAEHPFPIVRRRCGWAATRCRGMAGNETPRAPCSRWRTRRCGVGPGGPSCRRHRRHRDDRARKRPEAPGGDPGADKMRPAARPERLRVKKSNGKAD